MNMYNKNYLSKRPFLIVNTRFLPGQGARTEMKGWSEKAGWNVVEEVSIVDRVTTKHQTYATLIVDVLEAKCVKNGFNNATKEEAMSHFMDKYKEEIKESIGVWLEREAQKLAAEKVLELSTARQAVQESLAAHAIAQETAATEVEAVATEVAEAAAKAAE